jgi:hypothetical protein
MSLEAVRAFLEANAPDIAIIETVASSSTVELAAQAHGVDPAQIAKTICRRVGERREGVERPYPLPVQALDQATGYLMAAASARALIVRRTEGTALFARISLARTAWFLPPTLSSTKTPAQPPETDDDLAPQTELTDWGPARRIKFPVNMTGIPPACPSPAGKPRSSPPSW